MGWGITAKVYLSRITEDELRDRRYGGLIEHSKERLLMLAAATPRTVLHDDGVPINWEEYIHSEISDIMETLQDELPLIFVSDQLESGMGEVVEE